MEHKILTAESVCAGHPDKMCDQIADAILDAYLEKDKSARVACEVMATGHRIIIAGEITSKAKVNIREVVESVMDKIGLAHYRYRLAIHLNKQSPDISNGVNFSYESRNGELGSDSLTGAGDQGTVYGYATDECFQLLPLPLVLAHKICQKLDEARRSKAIGGILPDGKAQVSIEYENDEPLRVKTIVVSIQHRANPCPAILRREVIVKVLRPAFEFFPFDNDTEILINPSGRFVQGGPEADTGLTGRKIMVDTYGGLARHGGGALSGKDATKVDRSGAYMARFIAKQIVWAGYAKRCEVSISYAIGKADPVAFDIDTFGTETIPLDLLKRAVVATFNLRPSAIIRLLSLTNPVYSETSVYGHFKNTMMWESFSNATIENLHEAVRKYDN